MKKYLIILLLILPFTLKSQNVLRITQNGNIVKFQGNSAIYNPNETMEFITTQDASVDQVSITLIINSGDSLLLDWGDGNSSYVVGTGANQNLTSTYSTGNQVYTIKITGILSLLTKFYIYNEPTVTVTSSEIKKFTNLEWLEITFTGTNFLCNSTDLTGLTKLKKLIVRTPDPASIIDLADLPVSIEYLDIYFWSINFTANSTDLIPMPLTYLGLNMNIHDGDFHSKDVASKVLTGFFFTSSEPQDTVRSQDFVGDPITIWHRFGQSEGQDTINSLHFVGMPIVNFEQGHSGTRCIFNSSHFSAMSTLAKWQIYTDGGTYNIDFTDFSSLGLIYFYINGASDSYDIGGEPIADLPATLTTLQIFSVNNLDITSGTLPAWNSCNITLQNTHSTVDVDGFLNAYAGVAGAGVKTINLAGDNSARSSASDAAVSTLQGLGRTVTTN